MRLAIEGDHNGVLQDLQNFATVAPRRAGRIWRDFVGPKLVEKAKEFLGTRGPGAVAGTKENMPTEFLWGSWHKEGHIWSYIPGDLKDGNFGFSTRRPLTPKTTIKLRSQRQHPLALPLLDTGWLQESIYVSPVIYHTYGAEFTWGAKASYADLHEFGSASEKIHARPFLRPAMFWFDHSGYMRGRLAELIEKEMALFARHGELVR